MLQNIKTDKIETVKDFAYLGSITNPNRDCSQQIRRMLGIADTEERKDNQMLECIT